MRLVYKYWASQLISTPNQPRNFSRYEEELGDFLKGSVNDLSCKLQQLVMTLALSQPTGYRPVCQEILIAARNTKAVWPPVLQACYYEETLSLFNEYYQFLNDTVSFFSTRSW
jgi:hypothetical protein